MKRLLLCCLVAGLLTPTAAHADYVPYRGGCMYDTTNNPTGSGALGGRDVWTGVVSLFVAPTDGWPNDVPTGGAVTAWCVLMINGVSQGTVLGPVSGTGAVVASAPLQFRATVTDVVNLCTGLTTAAGTSLDCSEATTTQLIPQPIVDLIEMVLPLAEPVLGPIRDAYAALIGQSDAAACSALRALAPAVDAADRPDLLHVDPATGDAFSGPYWIWDCP